MPQRRLRLIAMSGLVGGALILSGAPSSAQSAPTPHVSVAVAARVSAAVPTDQRLTRMINRARARRGLRTVRLSAGMVTTARPWARMLAGSGWAGRLAHDPSYWGDIQSACRGTRAGSENVAFRYNRYRGNRSIIESRAAHRIFRAYMHSPPHRANILQPDVNHVGVVTMLRRASSDLVYVSNVMRFARASRC